MQDPEGWRQAAAALVAELRRRGFLGSDHVAAALLAVPRHRFVGGADPAAAYRDDALPTLYRGGEVLSTSSAPGVVALMAERLELAEGMRVLEVGTGTGYNAAVLACLVGRRGRVVTLEIEPELCAAATANLADWPQVEVVCADGAGGYPDGAPYDRVAVTAAVTEIPCAWVEQLRPGGLLVAPLYVAGQPCVVTFVRPERGGTAGLLGRALDPAVFLPLRGELAPAAGWQPVTGGWLAPPCGARAEDLPVLRVLLGSDPVRQRPEGLPDALGTRAWWTLPLFLAARHHPPHEPHAVTLQSGAVWAAGLLHAPPPPALAAAVMPAGLRQDSLELWSWGAAGTLVPALAAEVRRWAAHPRVEALSVAAVSHPSRGYHLALTWTGDTSSP